MSDVVRIEVDRAGQGLLQVDPKAKGVDLAIRLARQDDFAFIDALQKAENDKVGFMYEQAIRKRIEEGNMIVAEATKGVRSSGLGVGENDSACARTTGGTPIPPQDITPTPNPQNPTPIGYCLGVDRYQKRSELGIIYQMAVAPAFRRCNVAAALLQAQFDKSAYGTRLYCCWCKQSLKANRFWQSMGFVPLAFRAGGSGKYDVGRRLGGKGEAEGEGDGEADGLERVEEVTGGGVKALGIGGVKGEGVERSEAA